MTQIPVSQDTIDRNPAHKDVLVRTDEPMYKMRGRGVSNDTVSNPERWEGGTGKKNLTVQMGNKYGAVRTWSELCGRTFDSKAEARRGEELYLMQKAGEISSLSSQLPFRLSDEPKIDVTIDFAYCEKDGTMIYEDVKGILTRDSRTRYAWLYEKYGIKVRLLK